MRAKASIADPSAHEGEREIQSLAEALIAPIKVRLAVAYLICISVVASLCYPVADVLWRMEHHVSIVHHSGLVRVLGAKLTQTAHTYVHDSALGEPVYRNRVRAAEGDLFSTLKEAESHVAGLPNSLSAKRFGDLVQRSGPTVDEIHLAVDQLLGAKDNAAREAAFARLEAGEKELSTALLRFNQSTESLNRTRATQGRNALAVVVAALGVLGLLAGLAIVRPRLNRVRDDLVELHRERAQAAARLSLTEDQNRAKTTFLRVLNREVRNPIQAVLGGVSLLLEQEEDPEKRICSLEALRACNRMVRFVDLSVLASRAESGQIEETKSVTDVRRLLGELGAEFADLAMDKGLELIVEVDERVPSLVRAESIHLTAVLDPLLRNAVRFTQEGQIVVRATMAEAGRIRFWVEDSGPGIPAHLQPHLFASVSGEEALEQRRRLGIGCSLGLARQGAAALGGKIEFATVERAGTRFWLDLDLPAVRETSSNPSNPMFGKRVLCLEDHPVCMRALRDLLVSLGARPEVCSDPGEALGRLERESFDLLLVDLHLSESHGIDFARAVRERKGGDFPMAIMLSQRQADKHSEAIDELFDAILLKPVVGYRLLESAARAMEGERSPIAAPSGSVLVVDDNAVTRQVARRMLEREGFLVTLAENGADAIERVRHGSFDLVLMDWQMPKMSGLEATRAIRQLGGAASRLTILAFTAHSQPEDRDACLAAGMDGFLSKPLTAAELRQRLAAILPQAA